MTTNCNPYSNQNNSTPGTSGLCPKDFPVISLHQNVPQTYIVTVADTDLPPLNGGGGSLNASGNPNEYCRFMFSELPGAVPQVVVANRIDINVFEIHFQSGHVIRPGMWFADLIIYQTEGHDASDINNPNAPLNETNPAIPDSTAAIDAPGTRPVWSKHFYLQIDPNLHTNVYDYPLTIAEIRLALRDCPSGNFLIDDYEYSDKEIFYAIRSIVDMWNETPPPVATFTYTNFPFRYHWVQGTIGKLLRVAGRQKLRNWLPYSGGGVSVNDQSVWSSYHQLGDQYLKEFKEWMMAKKIEINIAGAFGGFPGFVTR